MLTGGAAIPIVADAAVAAGSGTAVFGAADAIEGTQDIYYGSTGDIDSTAVNGIKDDLFQGNEDAYYLTENAFAFAASAMIPIGQASTAGNLTFKSTATIVAKEGISMEAGAGAQKITTDVTGNDTAGMVAGMVASGVTAKGLNGIEAEANKLAKAPKGIDGATEGVGNVAEDVGKVVETSYGKSIENTEFFKENGGLDASDYISIHSRKHMYDPDTVSTPKKTQYGKDVNVGKLCEDTIMKPDEVIYNKDQNVMIYKKEYPFNISTSDTPTGTHRVFIPLNTQGKKTIRMSQFPLVGGN
ncbi:hypothetical protein [Agathobacter sp.]